MSIVFPLCPWLCPSWPLLAACLEIHSLVFKDMGHAFEATLVREFLEDTLKNLSQEMPYLRGLQYKLCVACPNCHQGKEEMCRACSDHMKTTCTHKDCLHLIDANEGQPDICKRKPWDMVAPVCGLKKWFLKRSQV